MGSTLGTRTMQESFPSMTFINFHILLWGRERSLHPQCCADLSFLKWGMGVTGYNTTGCLHTFSEIKCLDFYYLHWWSGWFSESETSEGGWGLLGQRLRPGVMMTLASYYCSTNEDSDISVLWCVQQSLECGGGKLLSLLWLLDSGTMWGSISL